MFIKKNKSAKNFSDYSLEQILHELRQTQSLNKSAEQFGRTGSALSKHLQTKHNIRWIKLKQELQNHSSTFFTNPPEVKTSEAVVPLDETSDTTEQDWFFADLEMLDQFDESIFDLTLS